MVPCRREPGRPDHSLAIDGQATRDRLRDPEPASERAFVGQGAEEGHEVTVYGLHVYRVPNGFSKTGKSYEEFAQIMEKHAREDAAKFFKEHDINESMCEMRYKLTKDASIHDELQAFSEEKNLDMLLIGSQGRTAAASLLLGSVSEEMLHYENNIPLFIVKEKDSNMGFFEALFKL